MDIFNLPAFVIGLSLGSFSLKSLEMAPNATIYFYYSPHNYTEFNFESASSWSKLNLPSAFDCSGTINPCIVAIDNADVIHIGTNSPEQDFAAKLASITSSTPYLGYTSANAYCYGQRTDSRND